MDYQTLRSQLIEEYNIKDLDTSLQDEIIITLAKVIQEKFLETIHTRIGNAMFDVLLAKQEEGLAHYEDALQAFVPDHQKIFDETRGEVIRTYKAFLERA